MNDNQYRNWYANSDKALEQHIGSYIKHHRMQQQQTQQEVAKQCQYKPFYSKFIRTW